MKKVLFWAYAILFIGAGSLIFTSCIPKTKSSIDPKNTQVIIGTATVSSSTEQPAPTPTIGYQSTISAQETQVRLINMTLAANQIAEAMITQRADEIKNEAASMRIQQTAIPLTSIAFSVGATQTAATYIPLTSTVGAEMRDFQNKQDQHEKELPDLIKRQAESEAYAAHAEEILLSEIFMRFSVSALFVVGSIALIFLIVRFSKKPNIEQQEEVSKADKTNSLKPIPIFEEVKKKDAQSAELRKVYTEVPCSPSEILILADGICRGMTLAIGQWEGTPIHRRLTEVRAWAINNLFAALITGKRGELIVTDKGKEFFEDVVNLKEPPAPFVCAYEDEVKTDNQTQQEESVDEQSQ